MKERFLPIGTVVLLKDGTKKIMILSYLIFPTGDAKDKKMYDYGGCTFPEGVIDSKVGIGFNHDQIAEVIHMGYEDDEYKEFNKTLGQYAEDFKEVYLQSVKNNSSEETKGEE